MKWQKILFTLVLSSSCNLNVLSQSPVIGILGAMEPEVKLLLEHIEHKKDTAIQGISFSTGKIHNRQVVITRSGIGKVNAAIITTLMIEHFQPGHIIFSGIAGGLNPSMHPGDVVVAEKIAYHDYGRKWPDSFETWATKL